MRSVQFNSWNIKVHSFISCKLHDGEVTHTKTSCQILTGVDGRFTIHYLNNTLTNGTNTVKWGITNSSTCTFCDQQQTLVHVISGCKTALLESRYNWCHDPILLNIYKTIKPQGMQAFVDIESYSIHQSLLAMSNDQISLFLKVIIYYY